MAVSLPIEKMSTAEKIKAMEILWDDLCKKANNISSPAWHSQILENREKEIENGDAKFVDWDKAKKKIQNSL